MVRVETWHMQRRGFLEGLLTNFPKFPGDCVTSTMFSQHCRKAYWTDLVHIKDCSDTENVYEQF